MSIFMQRFFYVNGNKVSKFLSDATVAKHLELVQNLKDARSQHSLYGLLNSTRTPGGGI